MKHINQIIMVPRKAAACLYSSKPKPLKESGIHISDLLAKPFLKLPWPITTAHPRVIQAQGSNPAEPDAGSALPSLSRPGDVYGWFSIVNYTFMLSSFFVSHL